MIVLYLVAVAEDLPVLVAAGNEVIVMTISQRYKKKLKL